MVLNWTLFQSWPTYTRSQVSLFFFSLEIWILRDTNSFNCSERLIIQALKWGQLAFLVQLSNVWAWVLFLDPISHSRKSSVCSKFGPNKMTQLCKHVLETFQVNRFDNTNQLLDQMSTMNMCRDFTCNLSVLTNLVTLLEENSKRKKKKTNQNGRFFTSLRCCSICQAFFFRSWFIKAKRQK